MWNRKVFIRIIEVLLCIACTVALRVTDDESRRVFHYLRNRSLEWSLLNNVTWGTIGAALASATCGGYIIISTGLLIAAATGEIRGRKTEVLFLGVGIILFGIVGALSLASIDSVPYDLIDNAAVLGGLCLITGLVFIIDLLMKPRYGETKHDGTQTIPEKEQAKHYVTTTTMTINEKELQPKNVSTSANWRSPTPEMKEKRNSMNDSLNDQDDQENRLERAERQIREYAQNIDNGRSKQLRGRDDRDGGKKTNGYYRNDEVYQRPVDEVDDIPPFPTHEATVFTKVIQPSVKIMRIERDNERGYDNYRLSDSSQYDNVPARMRGGSSPGILKRQHDAYSTDPRRLQGYPGTDQQRRQLTTQRDRDEIEMLEEYFDELRMSTTNTATRTTIAEPTTIRIGSSASRKIVGGTTSKTPVSPSDQGYVKHTASNWPQQLKSKDADDYEKNR
ncbi:uncharacterized protein LOC106658518 [Trichogramma pretiosum]|uniref:uncharacterized protein LOC106658518 n=1 Tax=Trichogramma pretiosum TaxID=7493 RepID=UPI0006C9D685|nr:uncharacterized protein LOC106658518 [Trichogramma pretiosum]